MKHCDEYIEDPTAPAVLRAFLARARSPSHGHLSRGPFPTLFATWHGERYRVVMASRIKKFENGFGYDLRVMVEELTDLSDTAEVGP